LPRAEPRDEEWWRAALRATYPSTLGLAVLAAISLTFSPMLAAVLAGVIGGLCVAGLLAALAG
jgi:membrane glycosyltransferase